MKNILRCLAVGSVAAVFVACASKKEAPATEPITPAPVAAPVATPEPTPVPTPMVAPVAAPVEDVSLEPVYFEFDSYSVTPAAQAILRKLAVGMKAKSTIKVQIEGHCDERGSNEYNLALGERRSRAVKDFLVGEGAPAESLSTISFGEEKPAVQGTGEDVWTKNRRAELKKM